MTKLRNINKNKLKHLLIAILCIVLSNMVTIDSFSTFAKEQEIDIKAKDCIYNINMLCFDSNDYLANNYELDMYNYIKNPYQGKTPDDKYYASIQKQTNTATAPKITVYNGALYHINGSTAGRANSEWIDGVIFDVYKAYLYAGILPSVALAQGWVESACFSSQGAIECHNYFGIKWKGTATNPKAQDLNAPYPTKPNGESVCIQQSWANAYFAYFNTPLEGFIMYGADPEHYYGYTNKNAYHTMRGAMLSGSYKNCFNGSSLSDLMTWVGTGNTGYPSSIMKILEDNKLYLFDDEEYMIAYLKAHGLYDGTSGIEVQGYTFYPGAGNYTFCSRNHVSGDLSTISFGGGMGAGEGRLAVDKMGSY